MTTRKDIETTLWNACDSFRGKIDSSSYKDYILSMSLRPCESFSSVLSILDDVHAGLAGAKTATGQICRVLALILYFL